MQLRIVVFCCAAVLCTGAAEPKQARDAAMKAAESAGGKFDTAYDLNAKAGLALSFMFRPVEPSLLQKLRDMSDLRVLCLEGMQLNSGHMEAVCSLTQVRRLVLSGSEFTDEAKKVIPRLRHLEELNLSHTKTNDDVLVGLESDQLLVLNLAFTNVTDATLIRLKGTPSLVKLMLMGDSITDAGLKGLPALKRLQFLILHETRITDAGIAELAKFPELWLLSLSQTQVSAAGLRKLRTLRSLRSLYLDGVRITEAEIKELVEFAQLEYLSLKETKIDDAGFRQLGKMKSLRRLNVAKTQVSEEAAKEMAEAIPGLKVEW